MEELPIGSEITLKVVEDTSNLCDECFFNELANDLHDDFCKRIKCCASERKDGINVHFVRVEN